MDIKERVRQQAGGYYRQGDYYCSEAIIRTIRDEFQLNVPDEVIAMASGFPVGMGGSGCTCGALVGGIMALGLFFGRSEPGSKKVDLAMALSKELYDYFIAQHKSTCCRVLTKGMELGSPVHMEQCIAFTGEMAAKATEIIERELAKATQT
ncbi:C-GCAxxG-C-C family (seleno)protein [Desulfitobacterium sp. AusDCA]|uniref:C-GCAxxG-C-C family (seleno)protein n=1 Tax=Desulfitobacterium sp. AusDCA TaxID=3240383 RepID=UPI003DA77CBD